MTKKKTPQSNTRSAPLSRQPYGYYSFIEMSTVPAVKEALFADKAKQVLEWADRKDARSLEGFCIAIGIGWTTLNDWRRESPEFNAACEQAKLKISTRRLERAENKQLSDSMYLQYAYHFSPMHREAMQEEADFKFKQAERLERMKAQLAKEYGIQASATAPINITIAKAEETDIVSEKLAARNKTSTK